jgi:hypothetical protein
MAKLTTDATKPICEHCGQAMARSLESERMLICSSGQHFKIVKTLRELDAIDRARQGKKEQGENKPTPGPTIRE